MNSSMSGVQGGVCGEGCDASTTLLVHHPPGVHQSGISEAHHLGVSWKTSCIGMID